ncbi:hypothetical protein GL213_14655 [Halogeometricum borinquense]|uniref:HVO-0234-like beta-propeller domain-containing protein n=1 Tax=Halogeometricum borinquense TaxID=60847 RepID=A0A6C0UEL1_9EURY|nr:hypothetical protein [Halogeometricum borinquense]QIB72983.1 hypothetical protein G3I44_00995 [Halogeometricum borinquense]QIQ77649.1 hypothetical protein GL213_14655 [Halogeometricum borinquense]
MPTIDEKRVYTDNTGTETVFVASDAGVVAVSVSDDLVGGFGIAHRCHAHDVAVGAETLAVAADEDVFCADLTTTDSADDLAFEATEFGPATAVGFDGETLLAGDDEGRVGRFDSGWTDLGRAEPVRAIDGPLVAAADGVHRVEADSLAPVGLDNAYDVVGRDPLAATETGLYKLGNGWMDVLNGAFETVNADGDGRAHAVGGGNLFARSESGEWTPEPVPVAEDVAAVTYGPQATYAVTTPGTFLVRLPGSEWRHQILGLQGVTAAAVV